MDTTETAPISEMPVLSHYLSFWDANAQRLILILVVIVIGLFLIQRFGPVISSFLLRFPSTSKYAADATLYFYVLFGYLLIGFTLSQMGVDPTIVHSLGFGLILAAIAVSMLIRPYLPKLPFQVGHLIRTGELLGKVEHISILSTRLKTFDGLVVNVPNARIVNDYVINYHSTPTRRIKVDFEIPLGQDVILAKEIIESILVEDPRTLPSPRPVVYMPSVSNGIIQLGGRAWVKNPKAWATRCDSVEKVMFAFEQANIIIAVPEHQVSLRSAAAPNSADPSSMDDIAEVMLGQTD